MSEHIVLLGDSIFDNAVYVPDGPSVMEHLRRILPDESKATMVAVDGATVSSVFDQLHRVPGDATYLVLSVGGNDALWMAGDLLSQSTENVRGSLQRIAEKCDEFSSQYQRLVDELRQQHVPLAVCTVYDAIPGLDAAETAGLCVFNDTITRTAFSLGLTLIDLRTVCNERSDYSIVSPIEPSASGGEKIARAIIQAVHHDDGDCRVIAAVEQ